MSSTAEARIWAVIGASGTGKGLWAKSQLRQIRPPRFVAWDFMDEYQEFGRQVTTLEGIRAAMLKAPGDKPLAVRYVPRGAGDKAVRREFEVLCELVYAWGNCVFVAEELANVTTPGWAPAAWRKMTTSGRHARVHIIGMTQTPALVDKTFLGNCTLAHVSALREHPHRMYVAQKLDISVAEVAELQKFQWIERDFDTGELRKGTISPPGKAPSGSGPRARPTGAATSGQPGRAAHSMGTSTHRQHSQEKRQ